jgi:hypothetical protein
MPVLWVPASARTTTKKPIDSEINSKAFKRKRYCDEEEGREGAYASDFEETFCEIAIIRDFPDTIWDIPQTVHPQLLSW